VGGIMTSRYIPESIQIGLFSNLPNRFAKLSTIFSQSMVEGKLDLHVIEGGVDQILPSRPLHCLIVDIEGFPDPLNLIRQIHFSHPSLVLLVFDSNCTGENVVNAVLAGVRGCIDSNCDSLTAHQAIKDVLDGLFWLSPQVMSMVIDRLLAIHRSQD
jgi:DNA-binding NarL/FixJ family response regulator